MKTGDFEKLQSAIFYFIQNFDFRIPVVWKVWCPAGSLSIKILSIYRQNSFFLMSPTMQFTNNFRPSGSAGPSVLAMGMWLDLLLVQWLVKVVQV